jgi:sugar/nucleoside kinase (ribokinase family)
LVAGFVGRAAVVIVCVGDLLIDIVCTLRQPLRRGTDAFSSNAFRRGGSAANVAAIAGWLGGHARFVGAVGDDEVGRDLTAALRHLNVEVCAPTIVGAASGSAVVLVEPDGERTMAPDKGASAALVNPQRSWLNGAIVLHVPLYAFGVEPLATTAQTLIAWAHEVGVAVSIDLSSLALLEDLGSTRVNELARLLHPQVVFANEQEAPAAGLFRDAGVFIEKRGADPVCVSVDGQLIEIAVPSIGTIANSTGAGDAFAAGVLSQWQPGCAVEARVHEGIRAAAAVLTGGAAAFAFAPTTGRTS